MSSIRRDVPSKETWGKLLIIFRNSYTMLINLMRLVTTLYSESGEESTSLVSPSPRD